MNARSMPGTQRGCVRSKPPRGLAVVSQRQRIVAGAQRRQQEFDLVEKAWPLVPGRWLMVCRDIHGSLLWLSCQATNVRYSAAINKRAS